MNSPLIFLAGGSYPRDDHVEAALRERLGSRFDPWIGQSELVALEGARPYDPDIARRLRGLKAAPTKGALLVGRSSGARVATLFAAHAPVLGVVCLGYPFRPPHLTLDSNRFAPLETIGVPTLIIQGDEDRYGGADITRDYPLSPFVSVRLISATHELTLSPSAWDQVAALILDFHDRVAAGRQPAPERFDEEFYSRTYPDIAAALTAGQLASGREHFQAHGRSEKRMYRVLREP